jgi:hypothetical protein
VNPSGNCLPFALQNIICVLLLEITQFLRETYQYMPKRLNPVSNLKHDGHYRETTKITRDPKTFAAVNENNSHLIQSDMKSVSKIDQTTVNKRSSTDNVSVTIVSPNETNENSKHISFAFSEKQEDQTSMNSGKVIRNTTPPPTQTDAHYNELKIGSSVKMNKSSFRRSSIKFRSNPSNRTTNIFNRRKSSHETNESIQENESGVSGGGGGGGGGFQTTFIYSNDDINKMDLSFHQNSKEISQINDSCEVDEVDFNRCYPWIKVSFQKIMTIPCYNSFLNFKLFSELKRL